MKRKITALFFLLFLPALVYAGTVGKIKGKVTDLQTGEPLIGANVIVVGTSFGAATDINGEYVISNLDAGTYSLKASYLGYKTVTVTEIRVNTDLTTEMNFRLPAQGVAVGEVEIVAKRPLINKSNTNAIRTTTNAEIEALPVRGVNEILALTPGVTVQDNTVYVRGGRQDEVGYYLEGTNITDPVFGGQAVTIVQDAIEEMQVQAGGYTAEFGGANAGIIRTQLKTGGPQIKASLEYITDNVTFKSKKDIFDGKKRLGAYWYGYSEFTGTLSGPVFTPKVKFFGLFNSRYEQDQNPQGFDGINLGLITDPGTGDSVVLNYPGGAVYKNASQRYNGTGTLTFDLNPFIVRLSGSYTSITSDRGGAFGNNTGNIADILDLNRIPIQKSYNGTVNLKFTHILSANTYYEVSAGLFFNGGKTYDPIMKDNFYNYNDLQDNQALGVGWTPSAGGRYSSPTPVSIYLFQFAAPNSILSNYSLDNNKNWNFSGSFSTELSKSNNLKFGAEFQIYDIHHYAIPTSGSLSKLYDEYTADPSGQSLDQRLIGYNVNYGVNNYGYDMQGNLFSGSSDYNTGKYAPKKPVFAGVYVEDKLEYENLLVNAGLRFDYINTDNMTLKDPSKPNLTINKSTFKYDPNGLAKVPSFTSLSPRLGFSFPITDNTIFHAQYGKFVQQSRLRDSYMGLNLFAHEITGGLFVQNPVGFDVRPTRTTQYEVGFTQQIGNFASFDVTGYYKDILDQVVYTRQPVGSSTGYGTYYIFTNGDFATTKGVEISFNMRRTERFMVNASMSFQDAQGTGSAPNADAGIVGAPLDPSTVFKPNYISPLTFNHPVSGNLNLDYRFGKDDGPSILHQFGVSALITFSSGHPFTLGQGKGDNNYSLEGDARFRSPVEPLNSSLTPSTFQVNLRVDKTISIWDRLSANIYIYVINLFDNKNVDNVFLRTGSANDDGFFSDPSLGGQQLAEKYGPQFVQMYNKINIDYAQAYQDNTGNLIYSQPRQIRLGIKLQY